MNYLRNQFAIRSVGISLTDRGSTYFKLDTAVPTYKNNHFLPYYKWFGNLGLPKNHLNTFFWVIDGIFRF